MIDTPEGLLEEISAAISAQRKARGVCLECGSSDHDGCLRSDGPGPTLSEFSAFALSVVLCAVGGLSRRG